MDASLEVNYPDSVHFLYALGNEIKTAKLGLERISQVLDALGRPQDRTRFVHVAGTNGKGSTCAMIASALRTAGQLPQTEIHSESVWHPRELQCEVCSPYPERFRQG